MSKDRHVLDSLQVDSQFSAHDAKHRNGFIAAPAVVVKHHGIVAGQVLGVFRALFRSDGRTVFRRQTTLAKRAGLSRPTVRKGIKTLIDAGLIVAEQPDPRQTIRYRATAAGRDVLEGEFLPIPNYARGLTGAARACYGVIIWRAGLSDGEDVCFDGVSAIARMAGLARCSAIRGIAALEDRDLVVREESPSGGPTRIRLQAPPPEGVSNVSTPCIKRFHGGVSNVSIPVRSGCKNSCKNHRVVSAKKLTKLTEADLRDDAALPGQLLNAVRLGIIPDSGQARLRFWTAATHCLRVAEDPPAVFSWIVHGGHWGHATEADEDVALDRLKSIGV